jgi:hypothetical protein
MITLASKLRTVAALGVPNLARVVSYRLGVRYGINPVRRLRGEAPRGPFFLASLDQPCATLPAVSAWREQALWFSHWPVALSDGAIPDWHSNPLSGQRVQAAGSDWWRIADFDPAVGDIKLVWEASRFDWVLAMAQRARRGEPGALAQLNAWLDDWCANNPPYKGPNWKCGQEAAIRVMHLAMASLILGPGCDTTALRALVRLHLRRIAPTIAYAVAQDNNHGTSEAAALFIGGSWLARHEDKAGSAWCDSGRRWLENRARRLIGADGSFSQYSLTYHRMMLDTLCMAELWRVRNAGASFSATLLARACAATNWLLHMIDPVSGDGPNLGANDGVRLLQLSDAAYRDFRPTLQLAACLFMDARAFDAEGAWNLPLRWLGLTVPARQLPPAGSAMFDEGGFAVLRQGQAMAMLRYPRFRFRPSQSDALHVDLWLGAENVLRDAGSYSYNAEPALTAYFAGTASHNTVQFDGADQMARWGRFLFADWLRTSAFSPLSVEDGQAQVGAAYQGASGVSHERTVTLSPARLQVRDQIARFAGKAVLRWRLAPGNWRVQGTGVTNGRHTLTVNASMPIVRLSLAEGWESRHYLEKTQLPVLEIEVNVSGEIISEYRWES